MADNDDIETIDCSDNESQGPSGMPPGNKKRSLVWDFFDKTDDSQVIICKLCLQKCKCDGRTRPLVTHLKSKHIVQYNGAVDAENVKDKPIMQLFQRLIGNDTKQNTVLTNAQIVELLKNEFNMKTSGLHELEIDIYMNVIKKFLKDWPQWEELDKIIKKEHGNRPLIQILLMEKYNSLKDYLKTVLEISKPMAKEAVENTELKDEDINNEIDTSDVVMEIQCTRKQLNELFYRQPHPEYGNSIFNTAENSLTSKIIVNTLPLEAILNWWDVSFSVHLKGFNYKREVIHELKHVLVNKKLQNQACESNSLDQELEIKTPSNNLKDCSYIDRSLIINFLDKTLQLKNARFVTPSVSQVFDVIFGIIKKDLENFTDPIRVPAMYRRYGNKYKYIRYLYKKTPLPQKGTKYDLQLEETISPRFMHNVGRFDPKCIECPMNSFWLTIECQTCSERFHETSMDLLKHHFRMHQSEPSWKCMNCDREFPMHVLAAQYWTHNC